MDFGGTFDDSIFCETRYREATPLKSYNAKICVPQWFVHAEPEDDTEEINLEKYKADFSYSQGDNETAMNHFTRCLELVPQSNMSMRRDIYESLTRCHIHLDSFDEALRSAELLYRDAQNFEQKTNTLRLLIEVYHKRNDAAAEALALERSIFLHPMHIDLWLSLAEAYIRIDLQDKIESNDGPSEGDAQSYNFFSNFNQRHLVSTCCIRALGLLDYSERMCQTFALEKLRKQREKIKEVLEAWNVSEEFVDHCLKVICADIWSTQETNNSHEESQIKPEKVISSSDYDLHKIFTDTWMAWKMDSSVY